LITPSSRSFDIYILGILTLSTSFDMSIPLFFSISLFYSSK
jgi:hypothetical protein